MLGGAALLVLAVALSAVSPAPVGVFWDDAVYVITAKALATGHGYHYINLPGAPAATHFPPLWPALLSLVWRVAPQFPENVRLMKLVSPLLLAAAAAGIAVLARTVARVPLWVAALVSAATLVLAPMLLLSAVLMSEPLCIALTAPALAAATAMVVRGRPRDGLIAGLFAGLAVLSRTAAIVLLPALAVGLLWRRSRKASALALVVAGVIWGPWFVWSAAHAHELGPALVASYGPYAGWALDAYRAEPSLVPAVVAKNAATMYRETGIVVFGLFPRAIRPVLLALLLACTAAGLAFTKRRVLPLAISVALYLVLVVVWPYAPGRFVWAYFSLMAVLAAAAAEALVRRARYASRNASRYAARHALRFALRATAAAAGVMSALAFVSIVRYDVVGLARGWHHTAIDGIADDLATSVGAVARTTAPADTVATDVNLTTYLYTGRIAVPISMLSVTEYIRPKTPARIRDEFVVIRDAFHPSWWIASGMVPERTDLAAWVMDSTSGLRGVAQLPGGGLAAREVRR